MQVRKHNGDHRGKYAGWSRRFTGEFFYLKIIDKNSLKNDLGDLYSSPLLLTSVYLLIFYLLNCLEVRSIFGYVWGTDSKTDVDLALAVEVFKYVKTDLNF